MQTAKFFSVLALAAIWLGGALLANASDYYIALGGADSNNGSIGSPFASFSKAIGTATPGDTIWVHGGTYTLGSTVSIGSSKDGTAANPYNLFAYPGEAPILDFRNETYSATNSGQKGIALSGDYWHVKGLTIQYAADNGMSISGSNNIVEQVVARQNQDSGFLISGNSTTHPSNNLLLNCDSYGNFDYGALGENADGFAVKFRGLGAGNVISGARAFANGDDGFDFWQAENGVTVTNSWSFHNGIASTFNVSGFAGDGNGIKLGHDSGTHLLENMLVWGNPANGVDINGNATQLEGDPPTIAHGVLVYNVTAAMNGGKNFQFDENPTTASPPTNHVLRNNVSFSGSTTVAAGNTADHNTFAGAGGSPAGLGASTADFVSIVDPVTSNGVFHPAGTGGDRSGATTPVYPTGPAVGPRQADGSLPVLDFLRLKSGSHLIDAGVNVGLPFTGTAPDVGAFEFVPPSPADFNNDGRVDAVDLAVWQAGFGLTNQSNHDGGDANGDGTVDAADFLIWQSTQAAATPVTSIPEPASLMLLLASSVIFVKAHRRWVATSATPSLAVI
jgi:hypothetical protein